VIFSVIVPFLNERHYIEKCIRSLLDQDFDKKQYELIFVDNNSTDGSGEIVEGFSEINFLNENKGGTFIAANTAMSVAKGDIYAFTAADCEARRDWLSVIYKAMSATGASIVGGEMAAPKNASRLARMAIEYENAKEEYIFTKCHRRFYCGLGNSMAIKKELFKKHGNFSKWNNGDTEFLQRCAAKDKDLKIVFLPDMVVTHLEMDKISVWWRKLWSYSLSRSTDNMPDYRHLPYGIRFSIFRFCCKKYKYKFLKSALFLLVLLSGLIVYQLRNALISFFIFYKKLVKRANGSHR